MLKLRFRVWPSDRVEDLDPALIEERLNRVAGLHRVEVFDDRVGDGFSVTVRILLPELSKEALTAITQTLLDLPRMDAFVLDEQSEPFPLTEMKLEDFEKFAQTVAE